MAANGAVRDPDQGHGQGQQQGEPDSQLDTCPLDVQSYAGPRILDMLKKEPGQKALVKEISRKARVPMESIYNEIRRLRLKGKIIKNGDGYWQLQCTATIPPIPEEEARLGHNFFIFWDPTRGTTDLTPKFGGLDTPEQQPLPGLDVATSDMDNAAWETVYEGKDRTVRVKPGARPQIRIGTSRFQLSGEVLDWVLGLVQYRYRWQGGPYDFETGPWWVSQFEIARDFENLKLEGVTCITYTDFRANIAAKAYNKSMPGGDVLRVEVLPRGGAVLLRDVRAFFRGEGTTGGIPALQAEVKALREEVKDARKETRLLSKATRALLDYIHAEAPRPQRKEAPLIESKPPVKALPIGVSALDILEKKCPGSKAKLEAAEKGVHQ